MPTGPSTQLAQLNIAKLVAPLDDPRLADFSGNLDRINALAESSDGFVWRLKGDGNDATSLRVFPDPTIIVNMSVWRDRESLRAFTYASDHTVFLRRRREFFVPMETAGLVLWHVRAGHEPTLGECRARIEHLDRHGSGSFAFLFRDRPAELVIERCHVDETNVTAMFNELDREVVSRNPSEMHDMTLAAEDVAPGNGGLYLMFVAGEPAGCGAIRRVEGNVGELRRMFVRPPFRGSGLGAAMVSHLCGTARDLGIGRVVLETDTRQPDAQQRYERAGFNKTTSYGPNRDRPYASFYAKDLGE